MLERVLPVGHNRSGATSDRDEPQPAHCAVRGGGLTLRKSGQPPPTSGAPIALATRVSRGRSRMEAGGVKLVGPKDGDGVFLGSIGVRFLIDGAESGERFAFLEHPMSPRALAGPLHRHSREDEYQLCDRGTYGRAARHFGMPVMSFAVSSRSSRLRASSSISASSPRWAVRFERVPSSSPSSSSATGSSHGRRRFPNCYSGSGCAWASRSPAAGRPDPRARSSPRRRLANVPSRSISRTTRRWPGWCCKT
jgi:hypothetical protein